MKLPKSGHSLRSPKNPKDKSTTDLFLFAERINLLGKIGLVVVFSSFNFVFWVTAFMEYSKSAENYIPENMRD